MAWYSLDIHAWVTIVMDMHAKCVQYRTLLGPSYHPMETCSFHGDPLCPMF